MATGEGAGEAGAAVKPGELDAAGCVESAAGEPVDTAVVLEVVVVSSGVPTGDLNCPELVDKFGAGASATEVESTEAESVEEATSGAIGAEAAKTPGDGTPVS